MSSISVLQVAKIFAAIFLVSSSAFAGSRYTCCLKRANGETFTVKGIASTFYSGTRASICFARAIDANAEVCEKAESPDRVDVDLVRKSISEPTDLSQIGCSVYPCQVTLHVPQGTRLAANARGPVQCSIRQTIFDSTGAEAHTLTITLGQLSYRAKRMGSCEVVTVGTPAVTQYTFDTNIDRENLQEYLDRAEKLRLERLK